MAMSDKMTVLILVLMEDTLRGKEWLTEHRYTPGLNPCFNGRYSQSQKVLYYYLHSISVLILVLMEDTLRVGSVIILTHLITSVLILVLMEDTLRAIHFINHLIIYRS